MENKRKIVRVEYYDYYTNGLDNDCYELTELNYFATKREDIKRACNDHYRKEKNKSSLMIYRIDKIIQIRHL